MDTKVVDLLNEIQEKHKQVSSSQKDEVRIMQAMLNDPSYEVGVYSSQGQIGTYSPAKEFKEMQSRIISSVAKISRDEATGLMENYDVSKADANVMVGISKEFINTYLNTGRKLALGGREKSNYTLAARDIPETEKTYQKREVDAAGNITWTPQKKTIPGHKGLRARSSCPAWVK